MINDPDVFVFAILEGRNIVKAVESGELSLTSTCRLTEEGAQRGGGVIAKNDRLRTEFKSLQEALEFSTEMVKTFDILGVQFVVHFPFHPQGNWGFSREEILQMAELGADLSVTALT